MYWASYLYWGSAFVNTIKVRTLWPRVEIIKSFDFNQNGRQNARALIYPVKINRLLGNLCSILAEPGVSVLKLMWVALAISNDTDLIPGKTWCKYQLIARYSHLSTVI